MIPMRTSTIFKSRWWALLWAAGIIWLALSVAGTGKSSGPASAKSEDVEKVGNALDRM